MDILKGLNQNHNKMIVLVTHNEDLLEYGTRHVRLNDGNIVEDVKVNE